MTQTLPRIRRQVADALTWPDAHVTFAQAVADLPVRLRGAVPRGLPYSPWQLVEHIRLAQTDILEFTVDPGYKHKEWPAAYWPNSPKPPNAQAWQRSVARVMSDQRRLARLILDTRRSPLQRAPSGTGQTLLREVLLTADHTAYHVGQIVLVRRLLGAWPAA